MAECVTNIESTERKKTGKAIFGKEEKDSAEINLKHTLVTEFSLMSSV